MQRKMILFTAPSGAGKTTVVRHLLSVFDFLDFSVSATTREKRQYEKEGVHYYFKSADEFKKLIQEDAFAEYEEVYTNQFYGTLKREINRIWDQGSVIVFDIDVKGAKTLKKLYKDQCLAVFIAPPSFEVLKERLEARNTENAETLEKRLKRVEQEMQYQHDFDTTLINDILEETLMEAELEVLQFLFPKSKLFMHGGI